MSARRPDDDVVQRRVDALRRSPRRRRRARSRPGPSRGRPRCRASARRTSPAGRTRRRPGRRRSPAARSGGTDPRAHGCDGSKPLRVLGDVAGGSWATRNASTTATVTPRPSIPVAHRGVEAVRGTQLARLVAARRVRAAPDGKPPPYGAGRWRAARRSSASTAAHCGSRGSVRPRGAVAGAGAQRRRGRAPAVGGAVVGTAMWVGLDEPRALVEADDAFDHAAQVARHARVGRRGRSSTPRTRYRSSRVANAASTCEPRVPRALTYIRLSGTYPTDSPWAGEPAG